MKHAVILAHPNVDSFNAAIARACVETLTEMGHDAALHDLYAMDFDPRLRASELPGPKGFTAAGDVVIERDRLADVDSFIFVYPFWFNAPPAILKGYVDRVFSMGFGYAPGVGGTKTLLDGRSLMSFTTSGAPDHWVNSTGAMQALTAVFDHHLAGVTGLTVFDHKHFGGIHSSLTKIAANDILGQVRASLRKTFPGRA
ncbi:MAG: NAD(P)H-dependent oxidoreductase [Caulobacter sp.]|nr:NAD(P)H-dependent oxidoreductase [Caulobacter sp.]